MRLRRALPLLVVLVTAPSAPAAVTLPSPGMLGVDGTVFSIASSGSRIVVTGDFEAVGRYVGGGAAVDSASGALDSSFPRVHGQVSDVVEDGSGGWYIGGAFNSVGDVRTNNVAHLLPSGAVDPRFRAPRSIEFASALVLMADRLYVANHGYQVQPVEYLDSTTGRRKGTDFQPESMDYASELIAVGHRLFVGGEQGVRAIDMRTGATDTGFDCAACKEPGRVTALYHGVHHLYVGTTSAGVFRVSNATGARDPGFAPAPNAVDEDDFEAGPLDFEPVNGKLVVAGRGLRLGGPSSTLVALDMETGAADPNYAAGFEAPLHDIAYRQGQKFVAGGDSHGGRPPAVYTLSIDTGAVLERAETELDGPIDAISGLDQQPYIGGRFGLWSATKANDAVVLDARSGKLAPGFSMVNHPDEVSHEEPLLLGDRMIFALRASDSEAHADRVRLIAYSTRTGRRIESFRPEPIYFDPRSEDDQWPAVVRARGGRIFVGHVRGDPQTTWPGARIHVLDATSGAETHRYNVPFDGYLTDLLPTRDRLFVTGSFRRYHLDGSPRHLATVALHPLTGEVDDAWDAHTNGPVHGIAGLDDRLFLTGNFDRAWGHEVSGLTSVLSNLNGYIVPDFVPRPDAVGEPNVLTPHLLAVGYRYDPAASVIDPYSGRRTSLGDFRGGRIELLEGVRGRTFASVVADFSYYLGQQAFIGFLPRAKIVG